MTRVRLQAGRPDSVAVGVGLRGGDPASLLTL